MTTDEPMDRLRATVAGDHRMRAGAADRLEADLRIAHADRSPRPGGVPVWRRPVALAGVAVVVMLVAVASLVVRDTAPSAALVLTDAAGVTVVLPDGSEVVDPEDGFRLPEGAVVSIAEGGRATIDDATIDEASVLEVRDGALVARVDVTTTEAPEVEAPTSTTVAVDRTTTTTLGPNDDRPDEPATTTTTSPPDDTRHDDPAASTTTLPVDRPDEKRRARDGEPHTAVDIGLQVEVADGGLRVRWSVAPLEPGWQVVVHRQIGDGERTVVVGPTAEAEGEIVDGPGGAAVDERRRVRYRVAVLDEAGELIGAGPFQSVRR